MIAFLSYVGLLALLIAWILTFRQNRAFALIIASLPAGAVLGICCGGSILVAAFVPICVWFLTKACPSLRTPQSATPIAKQNHLMDALLRSVISVVVGVIFFWIPLWIHSYFTRLAHGADIEDPVGVFLLFGLPIIIVFAILATISLKRAYLSAPSSSRVGRLVLVFGLAIFCWSPAAYFCFMTVTHRR
jgi:hypothetical protein